MKGPQGRLLLKYPWRAPRERFQSFAAPAIQTYGATVSTTLECFQKYEIESKIYKVLMAISPSMKGRMQLSASV